ncbi:hypothetical protein [Segatella maculosa]|uniref:hypothetical protein n=1 Tax=Segatella maculosa TaxID=439703 RepID=UPI0024901F42|nr:hypothetical protein [Segatella maculosa]
MKRTLVTTFLLSVVLSIEAQYMGVFKGYLYNDEYQVYINMDFYRNNIKVPGQEIFGELPGYFGSKRDGRKWLFVAAELKDSITAKLTITNDYGSEDLEAVLRRLPDGSFELQQNDGSTIKIAVNRKWVKIPKRLQFRASVTPITGPK